MLDKCIDLVERVSGRRPTGYVAPWWEFSNVTNELLLKHGIKYDHTLMHNDFQPYYVRVGDSWTKIDYSKPAEEWMKPLERGEETDLIEIPASWYLDDLPPMMFIKAAPNSHGFVNPRDIEQLWRDQFDWVYREYDYAVFTMTIHPDVSGRPQVLAHARADHRAHQQARRRPLGDLRRDRRRLRRALPAQRIGLTAGRRQPAAAASAAAGSTPAPSATWSRTRVFGPARSPAKSAPASARSRPPPRPYTGSTRPFGAARADDDVDARRDGLADPATTSSLAFPRPVPSSTIARLRPDSTDARRKRASLPA